MQTETGFHPMTDRYRFDFRDCTPAKGFAQVDTSQDASYFGTWANPFTFTIVTYCEGDITRRTAESAEEFRAEILGIKSWNEEHGHRFLGIDGMLDEKIIAGFTAVGLAELLH